MPRITADAGAGAERDDLHAERLAKVGEPAEQLRRFERLCHGHDPDLRDEREPERRPLPPAEVREGENRPDPLCERRLEMFVAVDA